MEQAPDQPDTPPLPPGGDFKMPSVDELLKALEDMDGLTEENKQELRESLLNPGNAQLPNSTPKPDLLVLFLLLTLLILVFVFFGYKLYKSLTDRERRKEEKRRQKQQKKKK